jgi:hypothetical protein
MVLEGALIAASDKNHVPDARGVGFFYGVLDQRFVYHWQHLFGLRLGGWQKTGA